MTVELSTSGSAAATAIVHSDDEGNEYVFFGEFLEIEPI